MSSAWSPGRSAGFGLGISSLGIFTVVPATGVGAILLVVAYINRSGRFYNPAHRLVPGLVLFAAGLVGHAWTERDVE